MLSAYNLIVDFTATEKNLSEEQFRQQVAECLSHLDALKGSFDKVPCTIVYYPPNAQPEETSLEYWSARAVVMISVGRDRGFWLLRLYESIVRLIELEQPPMIVHAEINVLGFSSQ